MTSKNRFIVCGHISVHNYFGDFYTFRDVAASTSHCCLFVSSHTHNHNQANLHSSTKSFFSSILSAVEAILVPQFHCGNWAQRRQQRNRRTSLCPHDKNRYPAPCPPGRLVIQFPRHWWEGHFGMWPLCRLCIDWKWSEGETLGEVIRGRKRF